MQNFKETFHVLRMKRGMDNNGENDSINSSVLISSPLAITGNEGISIWFIDCRSKETVSMLLGKKGHHKHRPEDVVSCITLMSNDKHSIQHNGKSWQRIVANVWETKVFM